MTAILRLNPVFLDIETTGLDPIPTEKKTECEIVAIGVGYIEDDKLRVEVLSRDEYSEDDMIVKAIYKLTENDSNCIIGYNISFDIPFISARYLKHEYNSSLVTRLRQLYRVDLMYVVTRYLQPNNKHVKLKEIAEYLGLPYDSEISGRDIPKLYEESKFAEIRAHCQRDIETIFHLFLRLKDLCKHNIQRRYRIDLPIEFEGEMEGWNRVLSSVG
ncbi:MULTISPECIES: ribonuclease H-like domain-containing protein [unclassified Archaeoglobus]|jgi:uncharacterized protein YprB with RNaseH-like and TPR domain|uniref:ribonuclease H-like domain-containing protein n=1 Tax=unclassified Archaeoglobus TaxID=2643606 RepID=UPI0025B7DC6B|nr:MULTISPECIES: ribonuclease H-like domain-containing protein [unclassified Archaeoglobus]